MKSAAARSQLRIVRDAPDSPWGTLRVSTLTRAAIAEATELSVSNGVLVDALEMLVCASLRAAELFPEWTRDHLADREDDIDSLARLLVAGNPSGSHWATALLGTGWPGGEAMTSGV